MTVEQLIKELKKMPLKAKVYWQDFDCDGHCVSSAPNSIFLLNFDNLTDDEQHENIWKLKGNHVIIRG